LLGKELPKPAHLRLSDWEISPLSENQKRYAIADAWAGLLVYEAITAGVQAPSVFARSMFSIPEHTQSPELNTTL
jgi:ribonuclease D